MKKHLILFIIVLFPLFSFSQQIRDAVYLKNGGLIYGTIVEIIPTETIKIQTADGSIFVYRMDEVEKITKEVKNNGKVSAPKDIIKRGYKGFFNITKGVSGTDILELSTTHGIQFNSYLYFGGGFGLVSINNENAFTIPMLNVRLNVREKNFTPFVDFKVGSGIQREVGLHLNPSVGVRLGGNVIAFNLSMSYVYQELSSYEGDYDDRYYDEGSNIFCFVLGFEF
jgi:hypothetical protein